MKTSGFIYWFLLAALHGPAQVSGLVPKQNNPGRIPDTIVFSSDSILPELAESVPEEGMSVGEEIGQAIFIPSVLNAGRDLFANIAAFQFSARRFRQKGLSAKFSEVMLNDIPMSQLQNGYVPWSSWGGLNEVMSGSVTVNGLKDNSYAFGVPGASAYIDLKAAHLRTQTTLSTTLANRGYRYRLAFTKVLPFNRNNWAAAFCFGQKLGENVKKPGAYFRSTAYFFALDKQVKHHLISLVVMGVWHSASKVNAVTAPLASLAGSRAYQPTWGYQEEKMRNAYLQNLHDPLLMISHESKEEGLQVYHTLAIGKGEKYATGLNWYKAADPRPDYYRYLPDFQQDSSLKQTLAMLYAERPELLQINWNHLYEVNGHSNEWMYDVDGVAGKNHFGKRSRYIVEDQVEQEQKIIFSNRINKQFSESLALAAFACYQWQSLHFFKRVNDLLGGEFFTDWNQFADDQQVNDFSLQNDLNRPNRLLYKGDAFGYDYIMLLQKMTLATQLSIQKKRFDFFAGIENGASACQRNGLVRNGVFPYNSFGTDGKERFHHIAFKSGFTLKHNGRNYSYLNLAWMNKAPLISELYISPRVNDNKISDRSMEKMFNIDLGYMLNAPELKFRFNAYLLTIHDGKSRMSFYHDAYRSLVNYSMWNINQFHAGIELAAELKVNERFTFNTALSAGKYFYTNRPSYRISMDNSEYAEEQGWVYLKNFPVTGSPQQAMSMGLVYKSPKGLLLNCTGNFMADNYISYNPIRRTKELLTAIPARADYTSITDPEKLPELFLVNFFAAQSVRLSKNAQGHYRNAQIFLSVNNCLGINFISGGYEQLRFDIAAADINKFPSKYYYSNGPDYSLSIRWQL